MWHKFKAWIGGLWGEITTQSLAVIGLLQYVMAMDEVKAAIATMPKAAAWAPTVMAVLTILAIVLRRKAPPPPSVPMPEGAKATQLGERTMVIETPTPLPASAVKAAATKPDVPAAVDPLAVPQ